MSKVTKDDKNISFIPFSKAVAAPEGNIYHCKNRWWCCDPERGLILWRGRPQCNSNELVARLLQAGIYPWAELKFMPSAFIPVDPADYGSEEG